MDWCAAAEVQVQGPAQRAVRRGLHDTPAELPPARHACVHALTSPAATPPPHTQHNATCGPPRPPSKPCQPGRPCKPRNPATARNPHPTSFLAPLSSCAVSPSTTPGKAAPSGSATSPSTASYTGTVATLAPLWANRLRRGGAMHVHVGGRIAGGGRVGVLCGRWAQGRRRHACRRVMLVLRHKAEVPGLQQAALCAHSSPSPYPGYLGLGSLTYGEWAGGLARRQRRGVPLPRRSALPYNARLPACLAHPSRCTTCRARPRQPSPPGSGTTLPCSRSQPSSSQPRKCTHTPARPPAHQPASHAPAQVPHHHHLVARAAQQQPAVG